MAQTRKFVVTIDGAAGTGKSTVAQELAIRLGAECLDSGAMYRAVAVLSIDRSIKPTDGVALASAIREVGIRFDWNTKPPTILLGDVDISQRIRELDISRVLSDVAKQPEVRKVLVEQQHQISESHPLLVTEGRDQGSVVFPHASARFFLQANVNERAKRRAKQLRARGTTVNEDVVQQDIETRDYIDLTREDSPLTCPDGATIIDTSLMSMIEVVDLMETEVTALLSR